MATGGNDEPKKKKNKKNKGQAQPSEEEKKEDQTVDLEKQVAEMKASWEEEKKALMDEKNRI